MTLACLLPTRAVGAGDLAQPLAALALEARGEEVSFFCHPTLVEHYRPLVPGPLAAAGSPLVFDHIILMTMAESPNNLQFDPPYGLPLSFPTGVRISLLSARGLFEYGYAQPDGIHFGGIELMRKAWPEIDAHVFNRLGPAGGGRGDLNIMTFFPYGWTFRYLGMGPINEFGFRITADLGALAARPGHHKLVCVFGGSAAFSMLCLPEQTFAAQLEARLNAHAASSGSGEIFTVLNFGQQGHCLLNSLVTWTLFCNGLRPEIVISHDGYNDAQFGMCSDPRLLTQHAITYHYSQEMWPRILHGVKDRRGQQEEALRSGKDYQVINNAGSVAKAYVVRKRQFRDLVTGTGGHFIWGLQPVFFSKAALSKTERPFVEAYTETGIGKLREVLQRMPAVYELLSTRVAYQPSDVVVDFHKIFSRLGSDMTLFGDIVHLLPVGDTIVAEAYFEAIRGLPNRTMH